MEDPSDRLLEDAFGLLHLAERLQDGGAEAKGKTRAQRNLEAASKYYEASFLMKRYVNRLPVGSDDSEAKKKLLLDKISHYETQAWTLLQQSPGGGDSSSHDEEEDEDEEATTATAPSRAALAFSRRKQSSFIHRQSEARGGTSGGNPQSFLPTSPSSSLSSILHPSAATVDTTAKAAMRQLEAEVSSTASQANSRLALALDFDEKGRKNEAIEKYVAAAELFLQAGRKAEKMGARDLDEVLKRRLAATLDRIEKLKSSHEQDTRALPTGPGRPMAASASAPQAAPAAAALTPQEVQVLKRSSTIASGLFMPWADEDVYALGTFPKPRKVVPWTDPDGLLKLSDKQQKRLYKWARPSEIMALRRSSSVPVMVHTITPYSIVQKYVTDCSFISSLCICAAFERRFHRRVVTSILYPQDDQGMPLYNPEGKYMVKLWLNGVARRVVVDDLLPVDRHGNLLCSQTDWKGGLELWVTIIEKAFMKLCGGKSVGYDFPGSNSGVDLFSLTGWIPERIFFPDDAKHVRDFETPVERAWERLYSAASYGDCLITVSTSSNLTEETAERVGLVTGHAYAVLQVIKTKSGVRLVQMKNPWAHKGWKGKYSSADKTSWADAAFCAEVGYNAELAASFDDGIFWIGWDDVVVYFRNLHLSWNPDLFSYRVVTHSLWPKDQGPDVDSFNVGENPQYVLTLSDEAIRKKAPVWILLSRHVTKAEQEGSEVTDYLTLHVHRNTKMKRRIWYPGGSHCVYTGAYTNNCHVLMRYDLMGPQDKYLSLILSQYQKSNDLAYTLSCFCTTDFCLGKPEKDPPYTIELDCEWTSHSSGGPPGSRTFGYNPMWSVAIPSGGAIVQVRCSSQKTFALNLMLVRVESLRQRVQWVEGEPAIDTGDYRHGFVASDSVVVPEGFYTLIASTFHPGQLGPFVVTVKSSAKLKLTPVD